MNNLQFHEMLKESFLRYLEVGSRSSKKLLNLHGAISWDLCARLNSDGQSNYQVESLGFGSGSEVQVKGRYGYKKIDITVTRNGNPIAGIAVKYVMSNYSQNSNNYFENMLGETANIRCVDIPYFQIFALPDKIPYFRKDGSIKKWETITANNLEKYIELSKEDFSVNMHVPNKMLVAVVSFASNEGGGFLQPQTKSDYINYYQSEEFSVVPSELKFAFGDAVIYNDYERFMGEVARAIHG